MRLFIIRLRKILLLDKLYLILLFLTFIFLFIYHINYKVSNKYSLNDNEFKLTIKKYNIDGDKLSIEFKENLIGVYYFKTKKEKNRFINTYSLNNIIYAKGNLKKVNNNTIPNTFNYNDYLKHKNIQYVLNIDTFNKIKNNKNILYRLKNFIYKRISNIKYNSYLYAFILGDSSYIDNSIYENYRINGITHLFALSGLHVSLFSSIILFILKKIKCNEKTTFIISSFILLFFSFIASFTPSILRATIFFILSNINQIYYFYIKPKHLLYITFIILVIINPNYIYNTGFILSFTITFFILLFNENSKSFNGMKSILIISFISFLSSLPIIVNMNYEINVISFINNLFFIPYVSYIVFPLSLLVLIIPKLSILLNILTNIMEYISSISSRIININIIVSKLSILEIIIYYFLLVLLIKKKKNIKIIFMIFVLILYFKPVFNKNNYIYFLDVGQGDSALIVTKNNKSILIDTGGKTNYYLEEWKQKNNSFNLMNSKLIPFFKSIGLKKIDYLFITHGDIDHCGYSEDLINSFDVKNIYINKGNVNNCENKTNGNVISKDSFIIDNVKILLLNDKIYNDENSNSLVLLIEIDNKNVLMMGDAPKSVEDSIVKNYNIGKVDILKVGHHGSNTSSGKYFINNINPSYSIISVGVNNKYGHPNNETLLNLNNSKIYRTDIDGSIMFKISNNNFKIETYNP